MISNTGTLSEKAWHDLSQAEASDYWYWDGTEVWDSNVTRGSNLAVQQADQVIAQHPGVDHTPPTVFVPQRDSYNPGAYEFGSTPEPSDFTVWTFAYDVSGLSSVTLKWRLDIDGTNPLSSTQNETYAGGSEVGPWQSLSMTGMNMPTQPGNILAPTYRAQEFSAMIAGQSNKLIDYYVEATDSRGNITRTDIQHVWVGGSTTSPGGGQFTLDGALDADAREIATGNGKHLYYSMHAGKLYVATDAAGDGNDRFIYVAHTPGAMAPANWAKSGQIAQWDAYLADENDNGWSGWFDAQGAVENATDHNGGVLEGTIDLAGEFGSIPSDLYLAVGVYPTADGTALLPADQLPGSLDNDGNIQAAEYLHLMLPMGWAIAGSGDWNTAWNWAEAIPNGTGAHAKFLNVIAAPATVSADTSVTVGQITFDSPYGYTLAGSGQLNIDVASGSAAINVNQGTHQIDLPASINDNTTATVASGALVRFTGSLHLLNGSILTAAGSGTMEINGPVTCSAGSGFRVNGGVLAANADLAGAVLNVDAGQAKLNVPQHLASLSVASGARATMLQRSSQPAGSAHTLCSDGLGINSGGTLDLNDNDLVVNGGDFSAIQALVFAGYASAPDSTRTGIISTTSQNAGGNTILLLFDNALAGATEWPGGSGETIAADAVVGRYTYFGDTNLDGQVTGDDYGAVDASLGSVGLAPGIAILAGDTNDDYAVTGDDYAAIDANLGLGVGTPLADVTVPEPAGGVVLMGVIGVLMTRRRR